MDYIEYVYKFLRKEMEETLSSSIIFKEAAIYLIGVRGFSALVEHDLLKLCGVIDGDEVYMLMELN